MDIGETLYVNTREDFRKWLAANYQAKKEIWLIQYKKATRKPSLTLAEAVEEAMCFGWTESIGFKRLDTERYVTRFTPRRAKSTWTERNRERARRMIAAGKMTAAGFATLPADMKQMTEKVRLTGGPDKSITWIWLDPADGQLKVEYYDFSEPAQKLFGNDIAWTITVTDMDKFLSSVSQTDAMLIPWMETYFKSYFGIKQWLEEHEIDFSIERASWA